jgi:hypothetical protein
VGNVASNAASGTDFTITFKPSVGPVITLASDLTLPTLTSGSLTVVGPAAAGAARLKIAVGAASTFKVSRPQGSGAATFVAFQSLDFQEVRFAATGPGELRFTDCSLKATAAGASGIKLDGTGGKPRLTLDKVTIEGYVNADSSAGVGGGVYVNTADIVATGAGFGGRAAVGCRLPPCGAVLAREGLVQKLGGPAIAGSTRARCSRRLALQGGEAAIRWRHACVSQSSRAL